MCPVKARSIWDAPWLEQTSRSSEPVSRQMALSDFQRNASDNQLLGEGALSPQPREGRIVCRIESLPLAT